MASSPQPQRSPAGQNGTSPAVTVDDLSSDSTYEKISKGMEITGMIAVGSGIPSVIRIPIPGTNGLAIELTPRGWTPKSGSTSSLFFQSMDGKRHLRLDYGYNKKTNAVEFHWNQKGTKDIFGIENHTPAGNMGEGLFKAAKGFRYAGRVLLVVGAVADVVSIVTAHDKWRQVAAVGGGWAGAWAGAEAGGAGGAWLGGLAGSEVPILGNAVGAAIGGFIGGIGGGIAGYWAGSHVATYVYDEGPTIAHQAAAAVEQLSSDAVQAMLQGLQTTH
jgi:hypothetical protein